MISWLHSPTLEQVAKYIECYWFIEKYSDSEGHAYPKLNPDPSAHLIICPEVQAYQYEVDERVDSGVGTHLLFPHLQTLVLDHSKPFLYLGIKFKVGALYCLGLTSDAYPVLDSTKQVGLATLADSHECTEQELIELARQEPNQCCERLDKLLLAWVKKAKEDKHTALTRRALQLLETTAIADLGELVHCSQRTLERSFNRVTGLNLKQCQSMQKLEAMLVYLYQRDINDINWSEVAFKFGFSDQPHLIRHLKKQIGTTPKAYAKERGLTIDVYGGVAPL